jgi:hypothetical protein
MANVSLPAASSYISDTTLAGTALPATEGTSLASNTGLMFTNTPAGLVVVRVVVGASGAGNATFTNTAGGANRVVALSNSSVYILGPFDPAVYSNTSGVVNCAFSVVTGNSAGLYWVPANYPFGTMRALHDPFNLTAGASTS